MTNKELVLKFYEEVFNNKDLSGLDEMMKDDYVQHNVTVEQGKQGFINFTKRFFTLDPHMEILNILENGDAIAVFFKCHCHANGTLNKVVDIFRIEDGKLAEHWDVVEHDVADF